MKKTAVTIIGWIISIGLLVMLASKLDFAKFWDELSNVSWPWLVAAALLNIVVILFKAIRWKWLTQYGAPVSLWNTFKATIIGMAGNNVLPARGGDVIKIFLLNKISNTGKTALASIAALDKLFDGLAIVILFALLSFHSNFPVWVQRGTTVVSIAISVIISVCALLLIHHKKQAAEEGIGRLNKTLGKIALGVSALASKNLVILTLANSILICALQVVTILFCQLAFGKHLDIWIPALVFVAINLAIIVPSAPSGAGPFEVAAVLAYSWLGVGKEAGTNIALMYHLIQIVPITLIGMWFYLVSGRGQISEAGSQTSEVRGAAGGI